MNSSIATVAAETIPLPQMVQTRSGAIFDPRERIWSFRDALRTVKVDFNQLLATDSFIEEAQYVLAWYAENRSADHLRNMFSRLRHFVDCIAAGTGGSMSAVDVLDILNYKASLSEEHRWYLSALSGLLTRWPKLGCTSVTDAAVTLLKELNKPGNRKGDAVRTLDKRDGPLSDLEREGLHLALDRQYQHNHLTLEDYALAKVGMVFSQRPVQIASLKICDVIRMALSNGEHEYVLRMPRAKQQHQLSRRSFKDRRLDRAFGDLLWRHAQEVRTRFDDDIDDPSELPLFPARRHRDDPPNGFMFHSTSNSLGVRLAMILDGTGVVSERTGEDLHVNPNRLKYTLGTNAAREGHSPLVIAELLDHNDLQNVGVYTAALPIVIERLDKAMALHLAPLVDAFTGTLVADESHAARGDDPTSRIIEPRITGSRQGMGTCGRCAKCSLLAPIACYTCPLFQPWVDGPHESVLNNLLQERERLMKIDPRMASVNDRTIMAVAQVILKCKMMSVQ